MKIKDIVNRDLVTLTNCEHEPIHTPGSIQSHGFLLGITPDWKIDFCTSNISQFIDIAHDHILGYKFEEIFGIPAQNFLYDYLHTTKAQLVFPLEIELMGKPFQITIHKSGTIYILEAEPQRAGKEQLADVYLQTIQFVSDMNSTRSLKELCALVAEGTRQITGYDRVMIYRFDDNYNGEIYAENCREDLEPFLGLHYPHTDIPAQARELYMKNQLRLIVDMGYEPVPIFTIDDQENKKLDLSLSILRSTSPIHIEYLQNMGVGATLTISLIHHGRLWGLIACHHYSPKNISPEIRLAAKLQGQFITSQIDIRQSNDEYEISRKTSEAFKLLTESLALQDTSFEVICADPELLNLCNAKGVSICMGGTIYKNGHTPQDEKIRQIISNMQLYGYGTTLSTNKLRNHMPDLDGCEKVSGIIYHSLGSGNSIIWYRPETVTEIDWAGDPEKAIIKDSNGLHPRNSFNLWKQIIKDQSSTWLHPELNAAAGYAHSLHKQIIMLLLGAEEEKYRKLSEVLQETNSELENINWISTHDLQEPLRKIQLIASKVALDLDNVPSVSIIDSLQRMTKSANRMQNLLVDILKYTRINHLAGSVEKVSLNSIMEETVADMEEAMNGRKAIFKCGNLPEVHAVPFLMTQLFSNILHNSLKYASAERDPIIEVTASQKPEINRYGNKAYCHWVTIKDNGIGFEQQYAESIFKVFTRLHGQEKYDGSGVGLALCKKIMQTCHGDIRAVGRLNEGTEITIYFPCDPSDPAKPIQVMPAHVPTLLPTFLG